MGFWSGRDAREARSTLAALGRRFAVVELGADGVILSSNKAFQSILGASTDTLAGQPFQAVFAVDDAEHLWRALSRGEEVADLVRVTGAGQEGWMQAVYVPRMGRGNRLASVVVYGADVTAQVGRAANLGQRQHVVDETQGVIEFSLDGMVLTANPAYLKIVGYRLDEIQGRHHSLFVDERESRSDAYIGFWRRLRSGLHDAGLYRRLGKGECVVWIQATYNPIFDADGRPVKIVKYAAEMSADALQAPPAAVPVAAVPVADAAVANVLDMLDNAAARANALSMDAAIDAALAEQRGQDGA
ncbi:PAS domain-containing protein [Luteibacter aegosomatissinici]|uniref:PAS domain-containing protein n=1 Tax=Luteibacter aegosomatissinici TaxID=2911539 RepID=UPI001FF8F205|nr:PAS domain-containing protein [Luteibacter aegosomatissinici]UPG95442.1 PAS domain-containing protein [Luteibacter aegosomatissinici]